MTLLSPAVGAVQVPVLNVEKLRDTGTGEGGAGSITAGLTLGGGNVYTLKADVSGRAFLRRGHHEGLLIVGLQFSSRSTGQGEQAARFADLFDRSARFEDAKLGHLRYGFTVTGPWAVEAFTQYQVDEFLLLEERVLVGAGLRLRVIGDRQGGGSVYLGVGYMIERETLDADRVIEPPVGTFHRVSSYIAAAQPFGDASSLNFTGYAQPRFDEPSDYRLVAEGAVRLGLTDQLKFVLPLRLRYDSAPAQAPDSSAQIDALDFELQPSLEASF